MGRELLPSNYHWNIRTHTQKCSLYTDVQHMSCMCFFHPLHLGRWTKFSHMFARELPTFHLIMHKPKNVA